jgi:hypothetical protein
MAKELKTQFSIGATVYAVVLDAAGEAWRTDSHVFELPTSANWGHYATAVAEQSGTGIYEGDFPTAITTAGAYNILFRQQSGGSPAAGDPTGGMIGGTIFWTGSAEAFPLASSATNATNVAMSGLGISSALADGSIDISTLTANLSAVLVRNYLITTGTTTPASADRWSVGGIYNNEVYFASKATGLFAWNNGSGWTISSVVGANGSAYWVTAGGANVTGPYTAGGTASGNPVVVAHGNAILNPFQPDVAFPANFASLGISAGGVADTNIVAWDGSAVGAMPGSGDVTVGGFVSELVDGNGLLKVGVEDWSGTAVSLSGGLPSVAAGNVNAGSGPVAINQNTGGTDNLRYVDSGGNGIEGATVLIYLATNWPAKPDQVEATAMTGSDGRWLAPAYVQSGTYVAVFAKIGADGPDVSPPFSV